ncbi:malate dehydrogenase, mitochondrial-like [Tribolium madens]|uniref:malate dehydrogenase, mitochondrial-like n=1 Tax=Tribolium madens TaxID=41895 RepID=UPI001CF73529|nr:malate dehydrogenase, mitochondrial-like [Tribolium madens]
MTTFHILTKFSRQFCSQRPQKHVQVCILGADTLLGQSLAFLIKQNPAISGLHLQGTSKVESMSLDLNHFDTRCKVHSYYDMDSVSKSVKCADIVVMLGLNTSTSKMSIPKLVMAEGVRVAKLAETCAKYAPRAVILVAVTPISVTLPIVAEVYKQSDWYHPGRLLGSAALAEVKANAIAGHYQNLDPQMVHVPIIGGPDLDCAIPLFSQTQPVGMAQKDADKLMEEFRKEIPQPTTSHAVGLNRMITGIATGINGDYNANVLAFVRTNIIKTCRYLVCIVKMGKMGILHNYGLQKLRRNELITFEETCLQLKAREEMASDLVNRQDKCALPAFMIREIEREKIEKLGIIR